jgi:hypothetical protein
MSWVFGARLTRQPVVILPATIEAALGTVNMVAAHMM